MSDSRWMALLIAAAFLVRLVAALGSAIFGTDSCHYLLMADWMRAGRMHDALGVLYHPGYPLLIAVVRTFLPTSEQAGLAVSTVLGSAAVAPLFRVLLTTFGRPAAVLGCLLYAFQPALLDVQSDVMTEGAFMFFLFGSMALTWKAMEEPSLVRGAVLGAAAAAAFLTRPEGLLAVVLAAAWPVVDVLRRRADWGRRLGTILATVAVAAILVFPYLLWVKSQRGHWSLSARPSTISAEHALGIGEVAAEEGGGDEHGGLYRTYAFALFRQSLYGLWVPFLIVGILGLRDVGPRRTLFYLSFPLGHLGGILFALRAHNFMSERYVMPGTALLGGLVAYGMVRTIRVAADRRPELRADPRVVLVLVLLLIVGPAVRALKVRRREYLAAPVAARAILARDPHPGTVTGVEQVSYLCGSRSYYHPTSRAGMEQLVADKHVRYIVYSDRDLRTQPGYVAMLRTWDRLEPPLEVEGPPGAWKVYVQRVK